jgi:hypothetical protein
MSDSDHDYFIRRASEERNAAARASHPLVRETHLALAARYEAAATMSADTKGSVEQHRLVPASMSRRS